MSDEATGYPLELSVDDIARAVLASDWYAEQIAQARREGAIEELEKAADLVARDRFASRAAVRVLRRRAAALRRGE